MKFASVSRRAIAFLIDAVPITMALFFLFYFTTDFGETVDKFHSPDRTFEDRKNFLSERNKIRNLSGFIYLVYAGLCEGSKLQGTLGKRLLGIRVVDLHGKTLTRKRAFTRNISKMLSFLPAFIGCLAALWHKRKQAWHDRIAKTYVLEKEASK